MAATVALPTLLSAQSDANTQRPAASSTSSSPAPAPEIWFPKGPLGLKWVSIGFRIPVSLHTEIPNKTYTSGTALPITTYTTTNDTPRTEIGLAMEFPLYRHLSLVSEGYFHLLKYNKVHELDQSGDSGEIVTTWTENTKADEWEIPVLLRYQGLRSGGFFSKMYGAGGVTYRKVDHVRTNTDYSYQVPAESAVTSSSDTPIALDKASMYGAEIAVGFRFIDDFNIRVTPEIRYTRWQGEVLNGFLTETKRGQLDFGVALTF